MQANQDNYFPVRLQKNKADIHMVKIKDYKPTILIMV